MAEVNYDGYNAILKSAEKHGSDSEPDHEVGDLQDALSIAWELLDEKARQTLVERFFDEVAEDSDIGEGPEEDEADTPKIVDG